jgi:AcrR family transcriptional regulator
MGKKLQQKTARVRDKDAKIASIIDATISLIEANGYSNVTTREIARAANVSNGLVFKYFPDGKPEIVKAILSKKFVLEVLNIYTPDTAEFDDFPGYMRKALSDSIAYARRHREIYTAITIASLSDTKFFEGLEDKIIVDESAIQIFLGKFNGINLEGRKNLWEFTAQWLDLLNGAIMHHLFYPSAFTTDDKLVDMLVEISLKLWGYDKPGP